ncbi:MAG: 30S ribosomal protein S12 methylthiotransferase RimO [Clostridia bacterium]|nr:30S ribosomal protein S12 methylthiotransferase RimO [Clostridia bacterium]
MKFNIGMVSLGCAKNRTDSETMLGILAESGHTLVGDPSEADVIIINTCGFIEAAKQESIDTILEMAEYKKTGRCKLLIVTGCLAERYNDEVMKEFPEADALLGVGDYHRIAEIINRAAEGERPAVYGHRDIDVPEGLPRIITTGGASAYIKIAEGCDNNCTYCAIPKIRGRYRSRTMDDIVKEAEELSENGVRELIVIAQDTTRYGIDLYGTYKLPELLRRLCSIEKLHWIRVHYFYTEAITDELIDVFAEEKKLCPYIDMPIQHINNDILRRMARRTNSAQIRQRIKDLREKIPDVTIRTSLITGFPGETEEQFKELCDFVKEARLERVGVFAFSEEEGTAAADFDGQLDEGTKNRRAEELMTIQRSISLEKNKEKLGYRVEVLCEGYDDECFLYYGRSRADSIDVDGKVYFAADDEVMPGEFKTVEILDCDEYDLTGKTI